MARHKHYDLIIAWLESIEKIARDKEMEYTKVKPKVDAEYRLALMKKEYNTWDDVWIAVANTNTDAYRLENNNCFVRWLTDWIGVEV